VKFVLAILGAVLLAAIGLLVYGELLEPDTRVIEQEALKAGDA